MDCNRAFTALTGLSKEEIRLFSPPEHHTESVKGYAPHHPV